MGIIAAAVLNTVNIELYEEFLEILVNKVCIVL